MTPEKRVELYKSGRAGSCNPKDFFTLVVGSEVVTMTAGEWARLISKPKIVQEETGPQVA